MRVVAETVHNPDICVVTVPPADSAHKGVSRMTRWWRNLQVPANGCCGRVAVALDDPYATFVWLPGVHGGPLGDSGCQLHWIIHVQL